MPVPNSNRSSSPISSTPHSTSRNSDPNSTARRSFSGNPSHKPSVLTNPRNLNPTTPANSPSGIGRRISAGYGGTDEKENDQSSIKPVKPRSSAIGSKNFMAPTISAACKSNPSPRKMVLEERNELVRTSISLSQGKASPFSSTDEGDVPKSYQKSVETHMESIPNDSEQKNSDLERPFVDKAIKRVRFADSTLDSGNSIEFDAESVLLHSDCVVTDMSAKIESSSDSVSRIIAPLDADLERPFVDKAIKRVRFADSILDSGNSTEFEADSVLLNSDCVVTDMSAKNESSSDSVSHIIAPLDADPSGLPYDPKTNYLSPRPRFLHYKPNPRIAVLINKEKGDDEGVKRLEDNFTSFESNSSDTTDSTEEILSSDDSQKDSEASSAEIDEPSKAEEEEEEEDILGSESLISGDKNVYENSGMVVEGKGKRGLVRRLRLIFMLVVLLISCYSISVTYSPGTADSTILQALNISQLNQPAAVVDLAKANFNLFSHRFKQFSIETMSHLSLPIINTGQGGQLSPLQFTNRTELQNDILVGGYLNEGSQKSPEWDDLEEECRVWDDLEQENRDWDDLEEENTDEIVELFEETLGEYVSDSSTEHEPAIENGLLLIGIPTDLASETICNQEEAAPCLDTELQDYVNPEHFAVLALKVHKEDNYVGNVNLDSHDNAEPSQDYVQPEHYEANAPVHEVSIDNIPENLEGSLNLESNANEERLSEDSIHTTIVELPSNREPSTLGNSRTKTSASHLTGNAAFVLSVLSSTLGNSRTKPSAYQLTGSAAALVLAVLSISFAASIIRKRGTDELLTKKPVLAATSAVEQLHQEKLSSPNLPTVDDIRESCSFEMSSYQSHNNNRLRSANEAESGERRPRKYSKRESFSSSDISFGGSPSYGSFTTYERIPVKNATGDDEVVTPVRRSSRLRSHVTS